MRHQLLAFCAVLVSLWCMMGPTVAVAETKQQNAEAKGTTLEDIGRGLKSAVQNVEKEIPKIGPAIGATLNKITGKESITTSSQKPQEDKK